MADEPAPKSETQPSKRKASSAAINDKSRRPIKRRASKACQCCRSRKVRCNVVEHGAPCTNCRLDEVECIVTESKRKRKTLPKLQDHVARGFTNSLPPVERRSSNSVLDGLTSLPQVQVTSEINEHIPHSLYRTHSDQVNTRDLYSRPPLNSSFSAPSGPIAVATPTDSSRSLTSGQDRKSWSAISLPNYFKPLPPRLGMDEREYLVKKNVLSIPDDELRNELLRCYVEFVHPFTPLLEVREFLQIIENGTGSTGRISLLLFHAVMFASSAFVDMIHLRRAGYGTRKEARKSFFQKVRILYDMDYEIDRFSIVQALLLLTSWDETPDDRKDTWHWAGIAFSTAIAIGLHRDPASSIMDQHKKRQWKRVWWSCIARDRQIALGMRRTSRLRPEDSDVPMLSIEDFEIQALPSEISCISDDCRIARDIGMQKSIAVICIEQMRLSVSLGKVLSSQYSLQQDPIPSHLDLEQYPTDNACYAELQNWYGHLPRDGRLNEVNQQQNVTRKDVPLLLSKALLHMVYFATLSTLQRPHTLFNPNTSALAALQGPNASASRDVIRECASQITSIATFLLMHDLARFLPTIAVTVLQPAITSHLFDIKSNDENIRKKGLQGFCQCIQVMNRLRDSYPAADHSVNLVEAAIRRADITVAFGTATDTEEEETAEQQERATCVEDLVGAGIRQNLVPPIPPSRALTPPPEDTESTASSDEEAVEHQHQQYPPAHPSSTTTWLTDPLARKFESFICATPPTSNEESRSTLDYLSHFPPSHPHSLGITPGGLLDQDFDSFVNMDDLDRFTLYPNHAMLAAAASVGGGEPTPMVMSLGVPFAQHAAPHADSNQMALPHSAAVSATGMVGSAGAVVDSAIKSAASPAQLRGKGKGMKGVQVAA